MWLMPAASTWARTWSAVSWLAAPSPAAPKMTRVERCPVRPNGAVGSMARPYFDRPSPVLRSLDRAQRNSGGSEPRFGPPRRGGDRVEAGDQEGVEGGVVVDVLGPEAGLDAEEVGPLGVGPSGRDVVGV